MSEPWTFTCTHCGWTGQSGWTQDDAKKESDELWGDLTNEETVTLCDDCFESLMTKMAKANQA